MRHDRKSAGDFGKGFLLCERRLVKRVLDSSVMSDCVAWSCSCHLGTVSGAQGKDHWSREVTESGFLMRSWKPQMVLCLKPTSA